MSEKVLIPHVSVVVVGTNEEKWLSECFLTLSDSSYNNYTILYIDNNSSDNSIPLVRGISSNIQIIKSEKNLGFSGANNLGIQYAVEKGSKYIFLVNPDTKTPRDLISELVEFMENNEEYGVVGPLQSEYNDDINDLETLNSWSLDALENENKHAFHHWEPWRPRIGNNNSNNILEHAYVQGCAFFFRSELIDKFGYLNPIFHTYYEEVDFCRKSRWVGYKVALLLNLRIQHYGGGGSQTKSYYRNYHYSRNKYIYLWTEPEYSKREALNLSLRWLKHDIKTAVRKKEPKDITDLKQLARILYWLFSHKKALNKIRESNIKLYKQNNNSVSISKNTEN